MTKRATSYDVAKLAGVSQATVSYVLNGTSRQTISEETRQRVLAAAKELSYYSNSAAQSLKRSHSGCISVVIDKQIEHPRYSETLQALRDELENHDCRVLLSRNDPAGNTPGFIRDYLEKRVDGIVFIGADSVKVPEQALALVLKHKIPFAALDCNITDSRIASVDIDYRFGMKAAVSKLHALGCGKIIYVCPESKTGQETSRAEEFSQSCHSLSMPAEMLPLRLDRYLTYEKTGLSYVQWLETLRDKVFQEDVFLMKQKFRSEPDSTGVICSWRAMRDIVLIALIKDRRSLPVITLTHEPSVMVYKGQLFHSALPNREAGQALARAVIHQVEDIARIDKVLINPGEIEEEGPY